MTLKPECDNIEPVCLTKAQKAFLELCVEVGHGKLLEVWVRDGEPVMVTEGFKTIKLD